MRLLHKFAQSSDAETLVEVLYAESIAASVRDGRDDESHVWVHDDDDVEAAKAVLDAYLAAPDDARFSKLKKQAKDKRSKAKAADKKSRHKVVRARETFKKPGLGPVTIGMMVICIFVAFITRLGAPSATTRQFLFFSWEELRGSFEYAQIFNEDLSLTATIALRSQLLWDTWQSGQVWRLVTPMVLHLSVMHILFNLWWWKDLAGDLEKVNSSGWLLVFTLVANFATNFTQYYFDAISFGGLSGVVYALFGYIWIRGRFDPTYPLALTRTTVLWMGAWYILCFTNFIPIANGGHTGGLIVGVIWGFFASGALKRRFLRPPSDLTKR